MQIIKLANLIKKIPIFMKIKIIEKDEYKIKTINDKE